MNFEQGDLVKRNKIWRKWKIPTNRGLVEGVTNGPLKVMLIDFGDMMQIKDNNGNVIITAGCVPPIYFER